MGCAPIDEATSEAMVHCWRLIGWHLGIADEYAQLCGRAAAVMILI